VTLDLTSFEQTLVEWIWCSCGLARAACWCAGRRRTARCLHSALRADFRACARVKLYVEEAGSPWGRRWVEAAQVVGIAAIGYVEAKAAFARAAHGGRVVRRRYRQMIADFEEDWSRYLVMEMNEPLLGQAGRLAERHRLRASDAVHLAAALEIRSHVPEEIAFLGFDDELNRAVKAEGLTLTPPPV